MLHFDWPWMLLLLPLPWMVARWLPPAKPVGMALFIPFVEQFSTRASYEIKGWSGVRKLLFALIWLLLILSALRPQWLGDPVPAPTSGRRLMMAVDVSGSMSSKDMAGNASRLEVVQQVAGDFIRRRQGDQVGLILFGTQPYLQAPLTQDLNTVDQFLNEAVIGVAGTQTAIGDAIGLAIKQLHEKNSKMVGKGKAVLILLTDGASNAGMMSPENAAKMAASVGLRIYTIGVGANDQTDFFGFGGGSDLDEVTLKNIARTTGGEYFRAADMQDLAKVYTRIDQLEPSNGRQQWYRPRDEWFYWPLALALLLSVPAVVWDRRQWI